ncbi:MAG: urease accessory protein UreD [Pseudanabaenaceae cyanobacterium]|jgi:urease accessory protein
MGTITMAQPWHGQLDLTFSAQRTDADIEVITTDQIPYQTRCRVHTCTAPYRMQRPFYPEGNGICHGVVLHTAGGMVQGDQLSLQVQSHSHSHGILTTAAATKIYRRDGASEQTEQSTTNPLRTRQKLQITIASQAWLEWLPQETIVFAGADYHQTQRIDLAPEGVYLGWEVVRFGRTARGEKFTTGDWRNHTEVWREGHPLWIDRQWLTGNVKTCQSIHGLADCAVIGTCGFVGQVCEPDLISELWAKLRLRQTNGQMLGEAGITRLLSGVVCRYRGNSSLEAQQWFWEVTQVLRQTYGGVTASVPRVWQWGQGSDGVS